MLKQSVAKYVRKLVSYYFPFDYRLSKKLSYVLIISTNISFSKVQSNMVWLNMHNSGDLENQAVGLEDQYFNSYVKKKCWGLNRVKNPQSKYLAIQISFQNIYPNILPKYLSKFPSKIPIQIFFQNIFPIHLKIIYRFIVNLFNIQIDTVPYTVQYMY